MSRGGLHVDGVLRDARPRTGAARRRAPPRPGDGEAVTDAERAVGGDVPVAPAVPGTTTSSSRCVEPGGLRGRHDVAPADRDAALDGAPGGVRLRERDRGGEGADVDGAASTPPRPAGRWRSQEVGAHVAGRNAGERSTAEQKVAVGGEAVDPWPGPARRPAAGTRLVAGRRVGDDLGEHRVVVRRRPCCPRRSRRRRGGLAASGKSNAVSSPLCGCQSRAGSSAYSRTSMA